jgi:hypothetical protein
MVGFVLSKKCVETLLSIKENFAASAMHPKRSPGLKSKTLYTFLLHLLSGPLAFIPRKFTAHAQQVLSLLLRLF